MPKFALILLVYLALQGSAGAAPPAEALNKIQHIVVIYLENHSFDNLYGLFPGADGIAQAKPEQYLQMDLTGKPYQTLPPVMEKGKTDPRFPTDLANKPFAINQYVAADQKTGDLIHRFYQHQEQINGGKLDRFAAVSDAGGLTMGYYDGSKLPLWQYAKRFTLADNFFQAAFGGSFINHHWLICACTPRYDNAPEELKIQFDSQGKRLKDGAVTPDGYVVNTLQPAYKPYAAKYADPTRRLPPQTQATIADRLNAKNIGWAWYAGGWNDAQAGRSGGNFQYHHQPFVYYQNFAEGSEQRQQHLKDETDFITAINQGTLPAVSFYKPIGELNEHPGYADVISGEQHIAGILDQIEHSPQWPNTVVIITYDEFGGFWDHVPPPVVDRFGPGSRIPTIVVSPLAKKGFVDHTVYDTTSILKLIETRFGLEPLTERDAKANDLLNALDW